MYLTKLYQIENDLKNQRNNGEILQRNETRMNFFGLYGDPCMSVRQTQA